MPTLIYVHKPRQDENIKTYVASLAINLLTGENIARDYNIPPIQTGEITIRASMRRITMAIPESVGNIPRASVLHKYIEGLSNETFITLHNSMYSKKTTVPSVLRNSSISRCLNIRHANLIIDTENIYKRSGWHVGIKPTDYNFESIVPLDSTMRSCFHGNIKTGTKWDILARLGLVEIPRKLKGSGSVIFIGGPQLQYNRCCHHELRGLFFIGWVRQFDTPLRSLPKGDAYCAACFQTRRYEQIAVMETDDFPKEYMSSIFTFDTQDHLDAVFDIVNNAKLTHDNVVLEGNEWTLINEEIYLPNSWRHFAPYVGKRIVCVT